MDAAKVAQQAGVGQLYLTHISSRYLSKDQKQLEVDARTVFNKTKLVSDYDEFDIKLLKV